MHPGAGTGTWFWVSAIAFFVLAVARYVIASRRSGRKVNPLVILFWVAAFGVGAVLSRTNSPWQSLILVLVPLFFARAGIAAIAYGSWLIGVRWGISVERRRQRRTPNPPEAEALPT